MRHQAKKAVVMYAVSVMTVLSCVHVAVSSVGPKAGSVSEYKAGKNLGEANGLQVHTGILLPAQLAKAALLLSDAIFVEVLRDTYCYFNNEYRDSLNSNLPDTYTDAVNLKSWREVPEKEAILHNFREDLILNTPRDRVKAALGAKAEYEAWKNGEVDRDNWRYLDPDLPNKKFVSTPGGHKEAVYNVHTGERVTSGNNMGTYNEYDQSSDDWIEKYVLHGASDVADWAICGTPADNKKIIAKLRTAVGELANTAGGTSVPEKVDFSRAESVSAEEKNAVADAKQNDSDINGQQRNPDDFELDTSRLEALLEKQISMAESFIARGKRVTEDKAREYNAVTEEIMAEMARIAQQVESLPLPDQEKVALLQRELEKATNLGKRLESLVGTAVERGLMDFTEASVVQQKADDLPSNEKQCSCADPEPYFPDLGNAILLKNGLYPVYCRKCGEILGIASPDGELTSPNKAAKGLIVKAPPNPIADFR